MANCIIGFPNWVDANPAFANVSFSNGSWASELPLTNLINPLLSKVARSTDASLTSTKFDVDLGVQRDARIFSIPKHNISRSGRIRIKAASDSLFTSIILDTDWFDVWRQVYNFGDLYWGHPSFLDLKLSAEDAYGYPMPAIYINSSLVVARYWRIEIDDTENDAGYVELGRLFICSGWQPSRNISYGNQLSWIDGTTFEESDGGAEYYNERPKRRTISFKIDNLTRDEALSWAFEMMRKQGISKQVMFIFDPDDDTHLHRTAFLATMRELTAIEYPFHELNSTAFILKEVVS